GLSAGRVRVAGSCSSMVRGQRAQTHRRGEPMSTPQRRSAGCMTRRLRSGALAFTSASLPVLVAVVALPAAAQSFRVQCPASTVTHPSSLHLNNSEPRYLGPTTFGVDSIGRYLVPQSNVNGAIKCQQISGGDGYSTMGDGTQTYMFSFGPLSGLADIASGKPGTEFPDVFNSV